MRHFLREKKHTKEIVVSEKKLEKEGDAIEIRTPEFIITEVGRAVPEPAFYFRPVGAEQVMTFFRFFPIFSDGLPHLLPVLSLPYLHFVCTLRSIHYL